MMKPSAFAGVFVSCKLRELSSCTRDPYFRPADLLPHITHSSRGGVSYQGADCAVSVAIHLGGSNQQM
jgi:hypothetical protein